MNSYCLNFENLLKLVLSYSVEKKKWMHFRDASTLGQKSPFYPEITKNLMFEKCEFCEKWGFENVNFAEIEIFKAWIL